MRVENGLATGNYPQGDGGGIFNSGNLTLEDSTVSGNIANGGGGGIFNESSATLTNSTVSENTAGGGIYNDSFSSAILTNSTVFGNIANSGGGIANMAGFFAAFTTLKNTILAGNIATSSSPDGLTTFHIGNGFLSNHYNLFGEDGTECNADVTDLTLVGLGKTITDILDPTTLELAPNSPAIFDRRIMVRQYPLFPLVYLTSRL